MRIASKFLALFLALGAATAAFAEGVDPKASVLFDLGGGWRITNSMMTGWIVSLVIIGLILYAVGRPQVLPGKAQSVFESLLEALRDLFEPIVGKKAFPAVFPLLVTLFIFILIQNWSGLLPGVGTVGVGHTDAEGHFHMTRSFVRPFTADFNSTIALALISFGAYLIIIFKYAGPKLILWDLFGNKADKKETPGWLYPILSLVFLVVGLIEVFSISIRPFTLSVRLFGNVFGGENLLHGTSFFPVFYFMELLVGLIQATVFTLLSAVYVGLICNHGDDHDHAHEGAHGEAHH
ncbi:MAG TPA: F0F1 ATP synthase subunit A [Acidobacteriota bacterium]|nr:F0F1 ATP synthase subunit A [Acidobacteriota bacterium]